VKAVVFHGPEDVRVESVPDPRLQEPTDAIVEVRATAICGADLFPYHGWTPGFEEGTVLGHEFVGVVRELGAGVAALRSGDRVVNTSLVLDGTCAYCRRGLATQCEGRALFGYSGVYPRLDGGQAELVRVPNADRVLAVLPEAIPDEAGVFLADNLPTGYGAIDRAGVASGDMVAVVGLGAVGLMAVMCALERGAGVLAIDGIAERRRLAATLGAEPVEPGAALDAVRAATGGLGADVVVEAAGTAGALDATFALARGRGTVSVVGAHFEPDYPLDNAVMFEKELTLRFTIGDSAGARPMLLDWLASGRLDPAQVVTHRVPLGEAGAAYRLFDAREATKVVLLPA
jgi:threonine dehydrogenase-like Zn-dependent dehydrogenase